MKPPRYLLREFMVLRVLKALPPGRFLELGYGEGGMLIALAQLGFSGVGFDPSPQAREAAQAALTNANVTDVRLVDALPENERFDYVLMFEVFGYLEDPRAYLESLKAVMHDDTLLIFSFTNSAHHGDAEVLTGDMACFSREEVEGLLSAAGYTAIEIINYGFPLTNLLRPLLDRYYRSRNAAGKCGGVAESGLHFRKSRLRRAGFLVNRVTLAPFAFLQLAFKNSDLGTGYLALARKCP